MKSVNDDVSSRTVIGDAKISLRRSFDFQPAGNGRKTAVEHALEAQVSVTTSVFLVRSVVVQEQRSSSQRSLENELKALLNRRILIFNLKKLIKFT